VNTDLFSRREEKRIKEVLATDFTPLEKDNARL